MIVTLSKFLHLRTLVLYKIPRHWSKWYWTRSVGTLVQVVLDENPRDTGPSGTGQDPQRHRSKWYWTRSLEIPVQVVLDKIPRDTGPSGTGQDP